MEAQEAVERAFGLSDKKKIQDLNVHEIFAGISKLEADGYGDAQSKSISVFIGATRCCKSTLINLFLNNPIIVKKDEAEGVPLVMRKIVLVEYQNSTGKFPVIGTKTTSETSVPMKYLLKECEVVCDCPGFGDSRGPQQEIINAWFLSRLFKTSQGVKLFNLCSAQSITDSHNVAEFRGYVHQIIDLFGEENLSGIKQTLVFTKSNKAVSAKDIKEGLMYLIQDHFRDSKSIFDFFNNAKVLKIDKATEEDIGKVLTKNDISELNIAYEEMEYQPIMPHVAIDHGAQVFLLKSIESFCRVAADNMKNAYKKAYKVTLTKAFQNIFKQECTEKDLMKLSDQFARAKEKCLKVVLDDHIISKELNLLKDIIDFVLSIISKDNNLNGGIERNIENMVKTSIQVVQCYNNMVMNYEFTISFLKFLKSNSNEITANEQLRKEWDTKIKTLPKPQFSDLSSDVTELFKQAGEMNVEIRKLHEKGNWEAERRLVMKYSEELNENQQKFQKNMKDYNERLEEETRYITWTRYFACAAIVVSPLLPKSYKRKLVNSVRGSIPDFSKLRNVEMKKVCTTLDRSFADYLQTQPFLGDIYRYWGTYIDIGRGGNDCLNLMDQLFI